jgi:hypothetical protein
MLQHEGAHLLAVNTERLNCCGPSANEIPHGPVAFVGNPHRRQFAGAQ